MLSRELEIAQVWGLAWDGAAIWAYVPGYYKRIDPTTGAVLASFPEPANTGNISWGWMTWDGTHLLAADTNTDHTFSLFQISVDGALQSTTRIPMHYCPQAGLASGDGYLFTGSCDEDSGQPRVFERLRNLTHDGYVPLPDTYYSQSGLAYGPAGVYVLYMVGTVFLVSPDDGRIIRIWQLPNGLGAGDFWALAFDGSGIWVTDTRKLYRFQLPEL